MRPDDRIALSGSNGSGESTLIGYIMQSLNLQEDHVTYVPQEIDIHASQDVMARARDLPNEKLGQMMTVVSRLGSRPHRLFFRWSFGGCWSSKNYVFNFTVDIR